MSKPPGRCIYCGSLGVTKAHVYNEWIRDRIPRVIDRTSQAIILAAVRDDETLSVLSEPRFRRGSLQDMQFRNVCGKCNGGWVSRIEEKAKPLLESLMVGGTIVLDVAAQTTLAAWMALLSVLGEFSHPDTAAIPSSDREHLWKEEVPTDRWLIFIGRYAGTEWYPARYRHVGSMLAHSISAPVRPWKLDPPCNTQTTAQVLEKLVVIAFSSSFLSSEEMRRHFRYPHLRRIWPPSPEGIDWTTAPELSDEYVMGVSDALHRFVGTGERGSR